MMFMESYCIVYLISEHLSLYYEVFVYCKTLLLSITNKRIIKKYYETYETFSLT